MREVNRSIVLTLIRLSQPISRIDLAKQTNFSFSNVSEIAEELLQDGLLIETRAKPDGRGRVPMHLSINGGGYPVVAVSIRRAETTIALSGLSGEVLSSHQILTPEEPMDMVRGIRKAVRGFQKTELAGKDKLHKIGISVPGTVDALTGRVLFAPALPCYMDFPLAAEVQQATSVPTAAENDCNLGAMADVWLSGFAVLAVNGFVFVEVGDVGVGGGIIINRELYRGHDHHFAAEFGHMVVDPAGTVCQCGRRGCWELFISDRATWQRYAPARPFEPALIHELIAAAHEGETRALQALRTTADYLSLGLSNIASALNPQRIILSGHITGALDLIAPSMAERFARERTQVEIRPARFTAEKLFVHGAIAMALSELFGRPKLGIIAAPNRQQADPRVARRSSGRG
ncbi:MAG TPA: ROK family protein [Bryobacteraceae bacterium]